LFGYIFIYFFCICLQFKEMQRRLKTAAELKRIQALKALFKKVVRMVSFNDPWKESDYDPRISANVPRNVSNRVRTKRKSGFLSAAV